MEEPMDAKTSGARGAMRARRTALPCDDGAELLLSASPSPAHYRAAAAQARLLQAMTTTPRLKQYLGDMIARYEGRAVDLEGSAKA
jgi:hypothetical protein